MRIYLDHNATAPLRPEARDAMVAFLGPPSNPSSAHREGARARAAVDAARTSVAALVGAASGEIVFTSGATEANNLALSGALGFAGAATTLVTTAVEHASVLEPARALAGARLRVVGVDAEGRVGVEAMRAAATGAALASVGLANGEVGTVAPLAEIAAAVRPAGVLLHSDAAQAVGRIPVDVRRLGVDLLSLSSHKLGGPAGVGALWLRPGVRIAPLHLGGPQERGRRAGTENVAAIAGFGAAARAALQELSAEQARARALTDRLWEGLVARVPGVVRNGPAGECRLPNTLNVSFAGCAGESIVVLLDLAGVAVSAGSACAAGAVEPSHVLLAMGRDGAAARGGIRLSVGPTTTAADIDRVLDLLPPLVRQVRSGAAA